MWWLIYTLAVISTEHNTKFRNKMGWQIKKQTFLKWFCHPTFCQEVTLVGNHQIFTDQFHGLEKAFCLAVYGLLKIKNDCEKGQ